MGFLEPLLAIVTQFADSFTAVTYSFGPFGIILFVIIYIAVILFFLPITPFSLAAGAIYGWWGVPIAYIGGVAGSMIAFNLARGIGQDHVRKLCEKRPVVHAIERVMVTGGLRLVLLVRLSGVLPFAVQNYSFGLSAVSWKSYLFASMIGLVPGAIIKVWIGKIGMDALNGDMLADRIQAASLIFAVALTVVMIVYIGALAVRELKEVGILEPEETL